jgi:hypothetical protein
MGWISEESERHLEQCRKEQYELTKYIIEAKQRNNPHE